MKTQTRASKINSLLSRKLISSARYNPRDSEIHSVREAQRYQEMGLPAPNGDTIDYTTMWDRAAEGFRRIDPDKVLITILFAQNKYERGTRPYIALSRLYSQYDKIPEEKRTDSSTNERFKDRIRKVLTDNPLKDNPRNV